MKVSDKLILHPPPQSQFSRKRHAVSIPPAMTEERSKGAGCSVRYGQESHGAERKCVNSGTDFWIVFISGGEMEEEWV